MSMPANVNQKQAKVVVACCRHDYGKPERGLSFEYYNLFLPMKEVASDVILFDFYGMTVKQARRE